MLLLPRPVRWLLGAAGSALAAFGLALLLGQGWAQRLWLWPAAPAPNHAFVGSVALAVAAQMLWIAVTGWGAALLPSALNLLVFAGGSCVALLASASFEADGRVRTYALLAGAAAALGAVLLVLLARRGAAAAPAPAERPARVVRLSFLGFAGLLLAIGGALLAGAPHVFPWPLATDAARVYASIGLGAAAFFAYLALRGDRHAARGALLGFLAYDAAVLGPLARHAASVPPGHGLSMVVYLGVVAYSALLALFVLALFVLAPGVRARRRSGLSAYPKPSRGS